MKGSSNVTMGATMAILIILAIVMFLVFVLLAELYCSILLRRRKLNDKNPQKLQNQTQLIPSSLSSFYAQGVLEAPRNLLFPKLHSKREIEERPKHGKLHQFLRIQSPQLLGLASSSLSSSTLQMQQPNPKPEIDIEIEVEGRNLMYISNPMYDNEVGGKSNVGLGGATPTPFETPDSSPSQLDGNEEEKGNEKEREWSPCSLPISPMKEVAAKDVVSVRDSSCSESNRFIAQFSSASPHTSPERS